MAAHIIGSIGGTQADSVPIKRALLSVSDKTGLVELGKALAAKNVELLSTGGTAKALRAAGLQVQDVADYTGFPEMLGGRVKTLHPKVHGGIMYVRGNTEHEASVAEAGIKGIDLVVLNLYAFEATVAKGSDFATWYARRARRRLPQRASVTTSPPPPFCATLSSAVASRTSTSVGHRCCAHQPRITTT